MKYGPRCCFVYLYPLTRSHVESRLEGALFGWRLKPGVGVWALGRWGVGGGGGGAWGLGWDGMGDIVTLFRRNCLWIILLFFAGTQKLNVCTVVVCVFVESYEWQQNMTAVESVYVVLDTLTALRNSQNRSLFTYLLTYSLKQIPSWEANRFAASQEIHSILWNPKVHYRISQVPATCPYPEPTRSRPYPHIPLPENPS